MIDRSIPPDRRSGFPTPRPVFYTQHSNSSPILPCFFLRSWGVPLHSKNAPDVHSFSDPSRLCKKPLCSHGGSEMRLGLDISQVGFRSWGQYFRCFRLRWRRRRQPKRQAGKLGALRTKRKLEGIMGAYKVRRPTIYGCSRASGGGGGGGSPLWRQGRPVKNSRSPAARSARRLAQKKQQPRVQASPFSLSLGFDDACLF